MLVLLALLHLIALLVQLAPIKLEAQERGITLVKPVQMAVDYVIQQVIVGDAFQVFIFPQVGRLAPDVIHPALNVFHPQNVCNAKRDII